MSDSHTPVHVSRLEKVKETASHSLIALSSIITVLFMIGQWLQYKFIVIGDDLFVNMNCLILPTLHCILETVTFILFFSINTISSKDISDKLEGIVIFFVCHTFGIFLSEYFTHHSKNLCFTPVAFLGLLILVLQNRTCTGMWETPFALVCHCTMTCGALLMTSYHHADGTGNILFSVSIIFYFNLRNIIMKQLAAGNIHLVLRMPMICTYVSILMLLIFIVGLLGIPSVTSFIVTGLFSSAASVVTLYLLLENVFKNYSVFFVTTLHLWSRILLQIICVSPTAYGTFITGGAAVCFATIVYLAYNSDEKDKNIPVILNNSPRVTQYEVYTRMEFLIYMGCVIGLVICLMQPSLSDRDRVNLQNIGIYSTTKDSVR
ncbi:uncharacterized protein LOC117317988 [Pecten maximus]|uniref:uncharacterized protein LOC117317988 n=1 Tax=Pecten maximus TaxID=6579 RepID=UPI0014586CDF|nr:uncharacterized protein LOC117317988 [Pecten maximus]